MVHVQSFLVLLGISLCVFPSHQTMAQQFSEIGVVYEAARNKIGLITYCRKNNLLDPAIAEQVITSVEAGLRELSSGDTFDTEQGDRAQEAGEDGFWESGRTRDISSVAALFRTTPADLCKEWAGETLRAQAPKPYREVRTFTVRPLPSAEARPQAGPIDPVSIEELPIEGVQVELDPVEVSPIDTASIEQDPIEAAPIEEDEQPAAANAAAKADAQSAAIPPLPVKAPFQPTAASNAKLVAWQRAFSASDPASTSKPVSANISRALALPPSAEPRPSEQDVPLPRPEPASLASEADIPIPSEPVGKTAVRRPRYDPSHPLYEKRSANRVGKVDQRCLMPGCKWRTPQERRAWQY